MGVPIIMVIIPLYTMIARSGVLKNTMSNRIVLIALFVATKIPLYDHVSDRVFRQHLQLYEEAAAIDGCHPVKTFWKSVFPLVQGGLVTVTSSLTSSASGTNISCPCSL